MSAGQTTHVSPNSLYFQIGSAHLPVLRKPPLLLHSRWHCLMSLRQSTESRNKKLDLPVLHFLFTVKYFSCLSLQSKLYSKTILDRCVAGFVLFCLRQLYPGCIYTSVAHAARPLPSKHDYAIASIAFEDKFSIGRSVVSFSPEVLTVWQHL